MYYMVFLMNAMRLDWESIYTSKVVVGIMEF